ncbi:MAG TPA: hypothetical protein VFM79_02085, partial [Pelobium sp.]|nr:hypothetical protein [Pelobium sp.]
MKRKKLQANLKLWVFVLACMLTFINCKKTKKVEVPKEETPTPTPTPTPNGFVHPGILNTQAQINFFVEKVNTNQQPWKAAFDELKESPYASLSYKHKPFISVDCGSYNKPNVGCDQQVLDGMAVYCQSLMYVITKDEKYAINATKILNDWSTT